MNRFVRTLSRSLSGIARHPRVFAHSFKTFPETASACEYARAFSAEGRKADGHPDPSPNPLWEHFQNHKSGPGIWKWEHYFDVYHRHLSKFVGRKVDVLEIGIYSGGSLEMWRSYFGDGSHIYGVDIEPACRVYEKDYVSVFIGDQADRSFWRAFRSDVKGVDVIIDDGGHSPEQQQVTLEETLQFLRPGGVYLCEDVHGSFNRFTAFAAGLVEELNDCRPVAGPLLQSGISPFQSAVHSIHFYPYMVVLEKNSTPLERLCAPKHGTEWQPFFDERPRA